jgi:hypothetical protein
MNTNQFAEPALADDQELLLLTDYVMGALSEAERNAFEQRMDEDTDFFLRVAPILDVWYSDIEVPAEVEPAKETERKPVRMRRPILWRPSLNHRHYGRAAAVIVAAALFARAAGPVIQRVASTPEFVPPPFTHVASGQSSVVAQRGPAVSKRPSPGATENDVDRAVPAARTSSLPAPGLTAVAPVPTAQPEAVAMSVPPMPADSMTILRPTPADSIPVVQPADSGGHIHVKNTTTETTSAPRGWARVIGGIKKIFGKHPGAGRL